MINESFFTLACAGLIGLFFGTFLVFAGYKFFMFLLPVWGFFFGLALGAQSVQVLLGDGFLASITSWVVGFVVGALFAVLSYLFYAFAVAIIAGSLGYVLTAGVLTWVGMDWGWLLWLIGLIVALVFVFVTIRFNLQKWVVIAATSILGAATIFGTIFLLFIPAARLLENPVKVILAESPFLAVLFILVAGLGIFVQFATTRSVVIAEYDRVGEL
jgi:hypothetical protein